jgi:hypothetical protein
MAFDVGKVNYLKRVNIMKIITGSEKKAEHFQSFALSHLKRSPLSRTV